MDANHNNLLARFYVLHSCNNANIGCLVARLLFVGMALLKIKVINLEKFEDFSVIPEARSILLVVGSLSE